MPDAWTDDARVAVAEERFRVAIELGYELMLAQTLGGPLDGGRPPADLLAAFTDARAEYIAAASGLLGVADDDVDALEQMRAQLAWVSSEVGVTGDANGTAVVDPDLADLRRTTIQRLGAARAHIAFDGESLDWLAVVERLTFVDDAPTRRRLFEALGGVWSSVAGDGDPRSPYRQLVTAAARTAGSPDAPPNAAASCFGFAAPIEPVLRSVLNAWRDAAAGDGLVEPWDLRAMGGAAARLLSPLIPRERLLEITYSHVRALGADPATLGIRHDVFDRPGRPVVPLAFALPRHVPVRLAGRWDPGEHWLVATYRRGGTGSLEELLHETGHTVHYAAIRCRPALHLPTDQTAWLECFADVLAWDLTEPWFQERWLGRSAPLADSRRLRYVSVVLDVAWALFELRMLADPAADPNQVWATIMENDVGVAGHPEWPWWAGRVQLVSDPGYMVNYALGAIVTADVRAAIERRAPEWRRGDDRSGWYGFVSQHLLRFGGSRQPAVVLQDFVGQPVGSAALERDLALAAF